MSELITRRGPRYEYPVCILPRLKPACGLCGATSTQTYQMRSVDESRCLDERGCYRRMRRDERHRVERDSL